LEENINVSAKLISKSIKLKHQINFNQYINVLRINYMVQMLNSDAKWTSYSNKALADNAGFNSVSSFYSYFKEFTKDTPGYYIQKLRAQKKTIESK
jgi:AraC-like DNA-binding protein